MPVDRDDVPATRDVLFVSRDGSPGQGDAVFALAGDVADLGDAVEPLGDVALDAGAVLAAFRHDAPVDRDARKLERDVMPLDRHDGSDVLDEVGESRDVANVREHVVPVDRHVVAGSQEDISGEREVIYERGSLVEEPWPDGGAGRAVLLEEVPLVPELGAVVSDDEPVSPSPLDNRPTRG